MSRWPKIEDGVMRLTPSQLSALIEGLEMDRPQFHFIPIAAILMPLGFFLSDAKAPNAFIYSTYVGATVVAIGVLVLGNARTGAEMIPHAYFVASPLITLNFALYGRVMNKVVLGYLAGAAGGFLWSVLAGFCASWLQRRAGSINGDAPLFCCIIDSGILTGSGLLYLRVFASALREASLTNDVLSAMMRPTVPYYIA